MFGPFIPEEQFQNMVRINALQALAQQPNAQIPGRQQNLQPYTLGELYFLENGTIDPNSFS
jgi:hypothetical protein